MRRKQNPSRLWSPDQSSFGQPNPRKPNKLGLEPDGSKEVSSIDPALQTDAFASALANRPPADNFEAADCERVAVMLAYRNSRAPLLEECDVGKSPPYHVRVSQSDDAARRSSVATLSGSHRSSRP